MFAIWLAMIIVLLCVLYTYITRTRVKNPPPGPPGWPILGCLLEIDPSHLHFNLDRWAKKYGPLILFRLATKKMIVMSCPRKVKKALMEKGYSEVLNDRPDSFISKYIMDEANGVLYGKKKTSVPVKKMLYKGLDMYGQGVQQFEAMALKEMEKLLKSVADQGGKDFNPREFLSNSVANLIVTLLIGSVTDKSYADVIWEYNNAFKETAEVATDAILWTFPFLRFLPVEAGRKYRRTIYAKKELIEKFYQSQKETYKAGRERGLVDALLKLHSQENRDGETQWLTDSQIRAIIQDIIFGGLASTTNSILFVLLVLLHRHECVDGIYKEIVKVVGVERYPGLKDKPAMPYTEAVILEALRYITHIPIAATHRAMEDVELEGYIIPKEATIMINIWTIHHDPAIWGDPWTFRPERFLDEVGGLLPADHVLRQSLVSFGVGERSCPGENLAKTRMFLCLTALVQKFDILPPDVGTLPSDDPRTFPFGASLKPPAYNMRAVARRI
ncbi:hypothetical protein CHS0354_036454 [Potamilus streckersoni]|uniref:Cytochrome P450 n=1 Tax=Potamilus streckersoni TaxID=2493646 RepID=A0AAE0SXK6_9BIVA|nr:hypothetical protein CHS0354_036454 [Potamilus streckersoni]